jgi:predicted nucleotidyltransferase
VLRSDRSEDARAGAALGLSQVVPKSPQFRRLFLDKIRSQHERPWVRNGCLQALEGLLGGDEEVQECFLECLQPTCPPQVQRFAAQALAEAAADGKVPWVSEILTQIETLLLAVPNPCPHALDALERLVEARELRACLRLEGILRDALRSLDPHIAIAFVYGSVARGKQGHDSDIDLMIIGNVRLKELSGALRGAERVLGRRISPVLYTPMSFRKKYQAGDPFLTHVLRNDRIFIKGGDDELGELVAERVSAEA